MKNTSLTGAERRWRRLVDEQERSGLSVQAFARARGLSAWSLYGWRSKLARGRRSRSPGSRRRAGGGGGAGLVGVDLVDEPVETPAAGSGAFEIVVGGRTRVRVPKGFEASELARVLEIVRRTC